MTKTDFERCWACGDMIIPGTGHDCGVNFVPKRPPVAQIPYCCPHCEVRYFSLHTCDPVTLTAARARKLLEAVRRAGDWSRGAPPHPGWWLASAERACNMWRWWNGYYWSVSAPDSCTAEDAAQSARYMAPFQHLIEWSPYWPADARVPRY